MNTIRSILKGLKAFRHSPKKYIVTIVLGVILIALFIYTVQQRNRSGIDYRTILDETAITVNDVNRSFRDVAFYVAYEEATVEEEAKIYNPENPSKYWNVHANGVFIRVAARNAVIEMAIHDEIFYQMAMEDGIALNEAEEESLESAVEDFWSDLDDYDKQDLLGVTREDIYGAMERMMYAQKYQLIYAGLQGEPTEYYDFSADAYAGVKAQEETSYNEELWSALQFGKITLR